ncbi:hypothetical protein TNCV_3161151 [Trichonephila clavipes]|nr:hypothetical protein TNCV_3161151 [Trichonephila clavipes]
MVDFVRLQCGSWCLYFAFRVNVTKRSKIIALNEHISVTLRDIATPVDVGKSTVSGILTAFSGSGSLSPQR